MAEIRPDNRNWFQRRGDAINNWIYDRGHGSVLRRPDPNDPLANFIKANEKRRLEKIELQIAVEKAFEQKLIDEARGDGNDIINFSKPSEAEGLRYPERAYVGKDTDYVLFAFGKYIPPFSQQARGDTIATKAAAGNQSSMDIMDKAGKSYHAGLPGYEQYKGSSRLRKIPGAKPIILPMPQDLSNTMDQNWNGKEFSRTGLTAISSLAGGSFADMGKQLGGSGKLTALTAGLTAKGLNTIEGVGGNLTLSDITGSTRGTVLNPNMEMLFERTDIREITMSYKLVPRNPEEADSIAKIIRMFRKAASASWGGTDSDATQDGVQSGTPHDLKGTWKKKEQGGTKIKEKDGKTAENFLHVPWLCQFQFMRGKKPNGHIPKWKPCALTRVGVNYTPDGTYATYADGRPVAIELTLNFVETKLIFRQDIEAGY